MPIFHPTSTWPILARDGLLQLRLADLHELQALRHQLGAEQSLPPKDGSRGGKLLPGGIWNPRCEPWCWKIWIYITGWFLRVNMLVIIFQQHGADGNDLRMDFRWYIYIYLNGGWAAWVIFFPPTRGDQIVGYGGFDQWGFPKMDGWWWKIPLKWMMTGGTPISGNHPMEVSENRATHSKIIYFLMSCPSMIP